jgi:hypothetical protein
MAWPPSGPIALELKSIYTMVFVHEMTSLKMTAPWSPMWFLARSTFAKPPVMSDLIIILVSTFADIKPRLCYKVDNISGIHL